MHHLPCPVSPLVQYSDDIPNFVLQAVPLSTRCRGRILILPHNLHLLWFALKKMRDKITVISYLSIHPKNIHKHVQYLSVFLSTEIMKNKAIKTAK